MTRISLVLVLACAIIVAACTSSDVGSSGPATRGDGGPTALGRIAILGDDGNIVTMSPDGSDTVEVTTDGPSVRYFQPVWSPVAPTIAFGQFEGTESSLGFADADGTDRRNVVMSQFPFYFYWSPDGERLGVLHYGAENTIEFEIVDAAGLTTSVVDTGSPYYFSWSPDGEAVVVHADGDRLAIFDESADPTDLGTPSPDFLSPRWTTSGIFFVGARGVVLRTHDGDNRLLGNPAGFANVNPNPDGSKVAIHTVGEGQGLTVGLTSQEDLPPDSVIIVDIATEEVEVVVDSFSLGSFWSPDGEKVLILVPGSSDGDFDMVLWESGETSTFGRNRDFRVVGEPGVAILRSVRAVVAGLESRIGRGGAPGDNRR